MKLKNQLVRDPISGYGFLIETPINLDNSYAYAIHPAYTLPLDRLYKECKKILLTQETLYNIQAKRLALGVLLYKLTESGMVEFRQFSSLNLSYNFFKDKELLTKFFTLLPRIIFSTPREKRKLPRFRVTNNEIGSIGPWIDLCIQQFNRIDSFIREQAESEQVSAFQRRAIALQSIYSKWKLYSTNPDKVPAKLIHHLFVVTATPPHKQEEWRIFLVESAGELYLKHKIRSTESVDLFWSLLEFVDHIECNDYQNTITKGIIKLLKKKVEEWVDWHPQFLELSLDYRLYTPKKKAIEGLNQFWISHNAALESEREERKKVAQTVEDRLKLIKERRQKELGHYAASAFTIEINNSSTTSAHSSTNQSQSDSSTEQESE